MKIFKKISIVILSIIAMFSFSMFFACDCGGSNSDTGSTPPPTPQVEIIEFNKKQLEMVVGEEEYVLASANSFAGIPLTYSSSDEKVASIDKYGKITANGKGEAIIYASYADMKGECRITVTHGNYLPSLVINNLSEDNKIVVPQGVDYAIDNYVLFNGKKFTNATYTYQTNNGNVRITEDGVIKGLNLGETKVTVTASWDGVSGIPALTKTFTVKVSHYIELLINGGSTSKVTLYNKPLETLNGLTPIDSDFVVTALDAGGQVLDYSVELVNENDAQYVVYNESEQKLVAQGLLTPTPVKVKVSVPVSETENYELFVEVECVRALGDYMNAEKTAYQVVDFNTLTGIIDLEAIFGFETKLDIAKLGREELITDGNKIVDGIEGDAFSEEPEHVIITLYDEQQGYNVEIIPYVYKNATIYAEDYQLSADSGEFFDADFKLKTVEDIFGADETYKEAYLKTADGQERLPLSSDLNEILGVEAGKSPKEVTLAIANDSKMFYITATAYTLIIDEMQDFDYFFVKDGTWSYHRQTRWSITAGMDWDGYYVLANNIDATEYHVLDEKGNLTETLGQFKGLQNRFPHINWNDELADASFSSMGATRTEAAFVKYGLKGKGLTGTFDGRGYTISNYNPSEGGLFQIVNGGLVKNIGFANISPNSDGVLASIIINGSQLENIFAEVNPEKGYGKLYSGTVLSNGITETCIARNVICVNESTARQTGSYSGYFGSNTTAYSDNYSNVFVISPIAYQTYYNRSTTKTYSDVYDAEYLDGVKLTETGSKATFIPKTRRYTNFLNMYKDAAAYKDNLNFDTNYWTMIGGVIPILTSSIKASDFKICFGDDFANETEGNVITLTDEVPVLTTYHGAPSTAVDSVVVNSGAEFVQVTDNVVKGIALGTANLTATYNYNGTEISVTFDLTVENPVIKLGGEVVDLQANTEIILGETKDVQLFFHSGEFANFTIAPSTQTNVITIDGKSVIASKTQTGTAEIKVGYNQAEIVFAVKVKCPDVYGDGKLLIGNTISLLPGDNVTISIYNGKNLIEGDITLTSDNELVTIDGTVITAGETSGDSVITLKHENGMQFTFDIKVVSVETLDIEPYFSAYDGVFFDSNLSYAIDKEVLFGNANATILSAKDADGNRYQVTEDGRILGIKTGNKLEQIELTIYSDIKAVKVNVKAYTLIIDEASDLAYFSINGSGTVLKDVLTYDGDDFIWDGYYVLIKDINAHAEGYLHHFNSNANFNPSELSMEAVAQTNYGLSGTFDGQGHTISNLYIASFAGNPGVVGGAGTGLFIYINGGTVKNLITDNLYSHYNGAGGCTPAHNGKTSNTSISLFATYLVNGAKIQDCYIDVGRTSAYNARLLYNNADSTSSLNNLVIDASAYTAFNAGGGGLFNANSATMNDVYYISKLPLSTAARNKKNAIIETISNGSTITQEWIKASIVSGSIDGVAQAGTVNYVYKSGEASDVYDFATYNVYDATEKTEGLEPLTPYSVKVVEGIKQYTTMASFKSDNKNDFSKWNADVWEIVNGVPMFASKLAQNDYTVYFGAKEVSSLVEGLIIGESIEVSIKANDYEIQGKPVVTITAGDAYASVTGTTVTALQKSGDETVTVTIKYRDYTWTQSLAVYDDIEAIAYETEFYYSAFDGEFFDSNFNPIDIRTIFGENAKIVRAYDEVGNKLVVNENGMITGVDLGKQTDYKSTTIDIYTVDEGYIVSVKAADAIIDEAKDLASITPQSTGTVTATSISYDGDDFVDDGYYVVIKDIDALDVYTHNYDTAANFNAATPSMETVAKSGLGFSGVFDGQGHTISNLWVSRFNGGENEGLFTWINGGTVKNLSLINICSHNNGSSIGTGNCKPTAGSHAVTGSLFATYLVNGAKIEDVYIEFGRSQNSNNRMLYANADDTSSLSQVYLEFTGYADFNANGAGLFRDSSATLTDVYYVSQLPVIIGTRQADGAKVVSKSDSAEIATRWNKVAAVAEYVDGVKHSGTIDYVYHSGTTTTKYAINDYNIFTKDATTPLTAYTASIYNGIKHYTSVAKMQSDAANNDFSNWNADVWEIVNGVPTFANKLVESDYTAYVGGIKVSEEVETLTVGDSLEVTIKAKGMDIAGQPVITIAEDNTFISANGATIEAIAPTNEIVTITITYRNCTWTQSYIIYDNISVEKYETEFYYSAYDGVFFDSKFNPVDIRTIFGESASLVRAYDAEGNKLSIDENGVITGLDLGKQSDYKSTTISIYTEDAGYMVSVKAADAIIDEASDLAVFTLKQEVTNYIVSPDGEGVFDGYYVLVNNIDASSYAHKFAGTSGFQAHTRTYATVKEDVKEGGIFYQKGFTGTFDGQGYTIDSFKYNSTNNTVTESFGGLFGIINGGTVKNVAFTNTQLLLGTESGLLATYIVGNANITDVRIEVVGSRNSGAQYIVASNVQDTANVQRMFVTWDGTSIAAYTANILVHASNVEEFSKVVKDSYFVSAAPAIFVQTSNLKGATATDADGNVVFGADGEARMHKVGADALYVDGVKNETATSNNFHRTWYINQIYSTVDYDIVCASKTYAKGTSYDITLINGLKRYTSLSKMTEDKANNNFSSWNSRVWEIVDGIPKFASELTATEYVAYVGSSAIGEEGIVIENESSKTITVKYGEKTIAGTPALSIVSGEDKISIDGNVITAKGVGEATVKVTYRGVEWNVKVVVDIKPTSYENELQFSAVDGLFFNGDQVVDVKTIFDSEEDVTIAKVLSGDGAVLTYEDGKVLGLNPESNTDWSQTSITLYTEGSAVKVNVQAADLIINEASDLSYFSFSSEDGFDAGSDGRSYIIADGEIEFDGYYVLAKDIDAAAEEYVHDFVNGSTFYTSNARGLDAVLSNLTDKGLTGTFDGQGYSISNLTYVSTVKEAAGGLFGFINGGTLKNLGFISPDLNTTYTNSPAGMGALADSIFNGATIKDCYFYLDKVLNVRNNKYFAIIIQSSTVMERVFIELNPVQAAMYNAGCDNGLFAGYTGMTDTYVVYKYNLDMGLNDKNATYLSATAEEGTQPTKKRLSRVTFDAATVDGVASSSTNNIFYTSSRWETSISFNTTDHTIVHKGITYEIGATYNVTLLNGVKRYTTLEKMEEAASTNDFSAWTNWTVTNGVPALIKK